MKYNKRIACRVFVIAELIFHVSSIRICTLLGQGQDPRLRMSYPICEPLPRKQTYGQKQCASEVGSIFFVIHANNTACHSSSSRQ